MATGNPGFRKERLTEIREARGLTGVALSELLGVSRQAVSQFERGRATPHSTTIARLSNVLNVPESFFWTIKPDHDNSNIFYRSLSAATKSARKRAERKFEWLKEIILYLSNFISFPEPNFPEPITNSVSLDDADIEKLAGQARRHWGLGDGPLGNITRLFEANGAIVSRLRLEANTLDAFSQWDNGLGRPLFVLGSDKDCCVRSRLDAGHEKAHVMLHRNGEGSITNQTIFKEYERQAFRFAAAFLLPAESFASDFLVPTLDTLMQLKKKWLVSVGMMIKRCSDLDLITETDSKRLWIGYSRRGWKKAEPFDDVLPVEQPTMLRQSFELLVTEGVQTKEQVLSSLSLNPADIEELAGLPEGFFLKEPEQRLIVDLKYRPRKENKPIEEQNPGEVVAFPAKGE